MRRVFFLCNFAQPRRANPLLLGGGDLCAGLAAAGGNAPSTTAQVRRRPERAIAAARVVESAACGHSASRTGSIQHRLSGRSAAHHRRRHVRGAGAGVARARGQHQSAVARHRRAELHARCASELAQAQAARTALETILADGGVTISRVGVDKYGGRVDATVATRDTADVSAALLSGGFARAYDGGQRGSWCGNRVGIGS